jgi:hypothetical protein
LERRERLAKALDDVLALLIGACPIAFNVHTMEWRD